MANGVVRRLPLRFALMASVAVLMHCGAAASAELAVCIDQTSPGASVDEKIAGAIAKAEHATLRVHAYKGLPKGDDDDFDLRNYKDMLAANCTLVLGYPHAANSDLPKFLKATAAYATTGFVLVTAADADASTLEAMPAGTHVAVGYNTLPNFFFNAHPNLVRDIVEYETEAIDAVSAHRAGGAMVWRATAAGYIGQNKALRKLKLHALAERNAQYDLVALTGKDDETTGKNFEAAIGALRADGTLATLLGDYAQVAITDAPADARIRLVAASRSAGARPARARRTARTCAVAANGKLDALYTEQQATTGQSMYEAKCALCHGPLLEGRAGPALKGKFFLSEEGKHTLGDIFTVVSQNMPAMAPASLTQDEYIQIMAFILQQNGYPAGKTELKFDEARKSTVPLRDHSR